MRWLLIASLLAATIAACDDDGGPGAPTPEGPTTVSLTKTVVPMSGDQFRFTLTLKNEGDSAAVNLSASDFWEEGLEVTAIGSVLGQQPKAIQDRGLEFLLPRFGAGESAELVYTARCRAGGEWLNAAAAGAANAEPDEASVTVTCP